jgi:hypothetical protein
MEVCVDTDGYKSDGTYDSESYFQVTTDCGTYGLKLHTSCSKPIFKDRAYALTPEGDMYVQGGDGDCIHDKDYCPPGTDKLYWIKGAFYVPCSAPADVTFNLYKDDDELKCTATAHINAAGVLTNIDNGFCAEITGGRLWSATFPGFMIDFTGYGQKADGKFETESRFELVVDGCGSFYFDQHTSCSKDIYAVNNMTPDGILYFTQCCAEECCEGGTPVEAGTWGTIKGLYR